MNFHSAAPSRDSLMHCAVNRDAAVDAENLILLICSLRSLELGIGVVY